MSIRHESVLLKEALEGLQIKKGGLYIDATLGGGGHTKEILALGGKVFALDLDPESIKKVAQDLVLKIEEGDVVSAKGESVTLAQGNFKNLKEIASKFGVWEASGILFDLGWSSLQMEARGLSFQSDNSLDMRLDPFLGVTAADLVNSLSTGELNELFINYGEESNSRRIARAIVQARVKEKITTTRQLAQVIEAAVPRRGKIHPATKVFQALRIVVNGEIDNLEQSLPQAEALLKKEGRLVVISFHSLEDRIVKNFFKNSKSLKIITSKPMVPRGEEILENPRSRSAKLRVAEKI